MSGDRQVDAGSFVLSASFAQKNRAGEHGGEYSGPAPSPKGSGLVVLYRMR